MAKKNNEEMDIKNEDMEFEEEQEGVNPWDAMWGFGPNRTHDEDEEEIEVKNETSYDDEDDEDDESEEDEDSDSWFSW
ncbi:hypothetical protein ACJROX_16300 [Pseudalkalibacillus sp. A8]|uniref:hypothetical protein n=1 Tax=Pseudalkalibacillus sp. A8 TaxID=3382641 RepID=UPI0038B56E6A